MKYKGGIPSGPRTFFELSSEYRNFICSRNNYVGLLMRWREMDRGGSGIAPESLGVDIYSNFFN